MRYAAFFFACAALMLGATASRADTISIKFLGVDDASNVTVTLTPSSGSPQTVSGQVGLYKWQQTNGATADGLPNTFYTFCIELLQDITVGTTYNSYSLTSLTNAPSPGVGLLDGNGPMDSGQADKLSALWAQFGSINTADRAATFQFAVWDVIYGVSHLSYAPYSRGGSAPNFPTDVSNAAKWATPVSSGGYLDTSAGGARTPNLFALSSPGAQGAQDQITTASAPLPTTVWGGVTLLGVVGTISAFSSARRKLLAA